MSIVFVVTDGFYSDYDIRGIFSTKTKAEAFIDSPYGRKNLQGGDVTIEEWELDDPRLESCHYEVFMTPEGVATYAALVPGAARGFNRWVMGWRGDAPRLVWNVLTDDEERAIKVTNEARVQILAMNLWGDPRLGEAIDENRSANGVSLIQEPGE